MGQPIERIHKPRDISFSSAVVVLAVLIFALNWAEAIFVPILLATLLTFILQPFVRSLERRGLGRTPAVLLTVVVIGFLLIGGSWLVLSEVYGLVDRLPEYTGNITAKVQSLRHFGGESTLKKLDFMVSEVNGAWSGERRSSTPTATPPPEDATAPMFSTILSHSSWLVGSALAGVINLSLAIVLVFFALLRREAIRARLLRMIGGRLAVATKGLDEAGERITLYLRRQLMINAGYGLVWGIALYFLGVEYALLWGVLSGALRYIPYAGPVLAGLFPITLSIAQSPGWEQPLYVIGVYLALELAINSFIEPWVYGQSLGISEVALLVSAAFWALLWGPIGLMLSGPITVCLAVVGRHVYKFRFLALILGDEEVMPMYSSLYQRLLARDQDEAAQLVLTQSKTLQEKTFDEILIPCLNLLKFDRQNNYITEEQEKYVLDAILEIVEELIPALGESTEECDEKAQVAASHSRSQVCLLAYPAHDAEDKLALEMLRSVLDPTRWRVDTVSIDTLTSELIDRVGEKSLQLVCIGALPPGGLSHTRYICKRLRARFPDVKIAVGRWAPKFDGETELDALKNVGADLIATSLLDTRDQLQSWLPVLIEEEKIAAAV